MKTPDRVSSETYKPIDEGLREALLTFMAYVPSAPRCRDCKYFGELADVHLDRFWVPVCNRASEAVGPLRIEKDGACRFFSPAGGDK